MYNDEVSRKSGWKLYTVKNVDRERNRVYLEGLVVRPAGNRVKRRLRTDVCAAKEIIATSTEAAKLRLAE